MCKHELYHFQACDHFGIEIHEVCSSALFTSGLKGYLTICKPDKIFRRFTGDEIHLTVTVLWHDIDGPCRECVEKHRMDETIYQTDDIHRSIHPAAIKASHPPLDPLARGPYVFVPRLAGSVFRLIGAGQIARDHWWAQGPTMVFPQTLLRPTWGQLHGQPGAAHELEIRGQWKGSGTEVDPESLDDVHGLLGISKKGMTRQDITDIMIEIKFNRDLESLGEKWAQMWAAGFAERGMPSEMFNETVVALMAQADIDQEEED